MIYQKSTPEEAHAWIGRWTSELAFARQEMTFFQHLLDRHFEEAAYSGSLPMLGNLVQEINLLSQNDLEWLHNRLSELSVKIVPEENWTDTSLRQKFRECGERMENLNLQLMELKKRIFSAVSRERPE